MFTSADEQQILNHNLTVDCVNQQLDNFTNGFATLPVVRVASIGDGIVRLENKTIDKSVEIYDKIIGKRKIVKFVPASGAATRMFKELFEFINEDKTSECVKTLLERLEEFAFYPALKEIVGDEQDPKAIVSAILNDGLEYGIRPKGQILFHSYPEGSRTAVAEHLVEGAMYARSGNEINIHLTVSPEHQEGFQKVIESVLHELQLKYSTHYNILYSKQKSSTDTIAVNLDNTPFRNADGTLLFRPSGHGALIENLNTIDADIVFIKNIDNVTTDRLKSDTVTYKKALASYLILLQDKSFEYIRKLDSSVSDELISEIVVFIEQNLCFELPSEFTTDYLRSVLDRPIRVCGMVKNDGEPGGGPFWVIRPDGAKSLQIAESSQISKKDAPLMKKATHFNPVDLVCGVRNYMGEKFDLSKYVDTTTGFISEKSKDGKSLKAQELPGLWNGAMADWNTIFVETPISTFSPVKTVIDLLRDQHK